MIVRFAACSVISTLLTACSVAPKSAQSAGQSSAASATGASVHAYGVNSASNAVSSDGLKVNVMTAPANQTYYFAFDDNTMRQNDIQALRIQTNYLITHPHAKVVLQGNTDDRGSREYNVALGWRRAQAVSHIMEQQGVKPSQIKMVSFGKERPVAMGEDKISWAQNRRVNLVYKAY